MGLDVCDRAGWSRWWFAALLVAGLALLSACEQRPQAELLVTMAADGPDADPGDGRCEMTPDQGDCSLRAAIEEANADPHRDQIRIAAGVTPSLAGTPEPITEHLVLRGEGATLSDPLVHQGGNLDILDLTIRDVVRADDCGGAIESSGGRLRMVRSHVEHNRNEGPVGSRGGGICATGPVELIDSVVAGNVVTAATGGEGGGIWAGDGLLLSGSTVSGNDVQSASGGSGGGVAVDGAGPLLVARSTISGNTAASGATAIAASDAAGLVVASTVVGTGAGPAVDASDLHVGASILDAPALVCAAGGEPVSEGSNLVRDGSCAFGGSGDAVGDALLAPLGDNGGPTPTHALGAESPAFDAIAPATASLCDGSLPSDQRGVARPTGAGCDTGAVEQQSVLVVDSPLDAVDATPGDGTCATAGAVCTLRAAIGEANASGGGTIVIGPGVQPVLSIAGRYDNVNATGDLDVTAPIAIDGRGATVDAAGLERVLHVQPTGTLVVRDLTVTGGVVDGDSLTGANFSLSGAGLLAEGDTVLERVTISGNQALVCPCLGLGVPTQGAAIGATAVRVEIRDSTISGNRAHTNVLQNPQVIHSAVTGYGTELVVTRSTIGPNRAGGIRVYDGDVAIDRSTVAENEETGIWIDGGTAQIEASTVAGNLGPAVTGAGAVTVGGSILAAPTADCAASSLTSTGHNLASDASCGLGGPGDQSITDPRLGALADNGGPTATMLPAADSPALDVVPVGTPDRCSPSGATDQRGSARPLGSACDVGAVEGSGPPPGPPLSLVVDTPDDLTDANPGDGVCATAAATCSLRAAVTEANLRPTDDTITLITSVVLDRAGAFEEGNDTGDLDVYGHLTIEGAGYEVTAASGDRVIDHRGARLTVRDLTIQGGDVQAPGDPGIAAGGGVRATGKLVIESSTVSGNSTSGAGGGLAVYEAELVATDVIDNASGGKGGGILALGQLTFSGGNVENNGGGGSILVQHSGHARFVASTIADNMGAGVETTFDATTELVRSTVSGNQEGLRGEGTFVLDATTVYANGGSAIRGDSTARVRLTARASILSSGSGQACQYVRAANTTSLGHNLIGDATCNLATGSDLPNISPVLAPLADNGGPTRTHLPAANSPAVDAIPAGTLEACDGTTPPDQRGVARPQGAACDIGAVEGSGPALPTVDPVVDTADDGVDVAPGDGVCATVAETCSLRAAVQEANASPGYDTITFAPGVHPTLALPGQNEDLSATGDLDVREGLTIVGDDTVVDGGQVDRVFDVRTGPLVLQALTVTGGRVDQADPVTNNRTGGGIRANDASLVLESVTVTGNEVDPTQGFGGGIATRSLSTITDSVISENTAGSAGGLHVNGSDASLTMTGSEVIDNTATVSDGGGMIVSQASITDSSIVGNETPTNGGGVRAAGGVSITDSTISGNTARDGGGISVGGSPLTLARLTVSENEATRDGGGLALGSVDSPSITSSTFVGNQAGRYGGGVSLFLSTTFTNVTFSGNHAVTDGGAIQANTNASVETTLQHVTVVGNTSGGAALRGATKIRSYMSILTGPNPVCSGTMLAGGGGNVTTDAACGLAHATDIVVADALLGPLADNGGPTWTHLPGPLSAAIDRVVSGTAGLCDGSVPVDQRGLPRPAGTGCDAGAVESQPG